MLPITELPQIIQLVMFGISTLEQLIAKHRAATGKSQGELLREALVNTESNDKLADEIISQAQSMLLQQIAIVGSDSSLLQLIKSGTVEENLSKIAQLAITLAKSQPAMSFDEFETKGGGGKVKT